MAFVEGFLVPCPVANRDQYVAHASLVSRAFTKAGATRMVEAWGDDLPDGKINDLKQAVQAAPDETVVFAWIEYPDRATRDAAGAATGNEPELADMEVPFDARRMIFSFFEIVAEEGEGGDMGFIDAVILPVPTDGKDSYVAFSRKVGGAFVEHGATRVVDAWGVDVPDGKVTDYNRATLKKPDETVVFSWVEWPSKQVRDAAWERLMKDERMAAGPDRPFDGMRMMFGGFTPVIDARAA